MKHTHNQTGETVEKIREPGCEATHGFAFNVSRCLEMAKKTLDNDHLCSGLNTFWFAVLK